MSQPLPWKEGVLPLMLAPMQGLTNRALRSLFIEQVRPDTVFTEFMRVRHAEAKPLAAADLREVASEEQGVPLVVQLVGHGEERLSAAAAAALEAGAVHLNLNMGCPYGRMTSGLTGGGMLRRPEELRGILPALRRTVRGSFSVKMRCGYDDPEQVFSLLPLLEDSGIDFLVLHPRLVVQEYAGSADHALTARVVERTRLPVIANGDIRTAAQGRRVLGETGAAGLMLGRGAIADPLLFRRLRGEQPGEPGEEERLASLCRYLSDLTQRYRLLFCGDTQVLGKLKSVVATLEGEQLRPMVKRLQKAKTLAAFTACLEAERGHS